MKLIWRTSNINIIAWGILFTGLVASRALGQTDPVRYIPVPNWPALPTGIEMGQVTGVATDDGQHVYVFHRSDRTWITPFPTDSIKGQTIAVFDSVTGELISTLGHRMFVMPHGLSVDAAGNLWLTDVGSHQVFKLDSASGRVLLTLGTSGVAGSDGSHFNRPTDVGFGRDGTIYVADGYLNTRIVRFSPAGEYLGQWGTPGSQPGQFSLPHGITVSRKRVFVCDRGNLRVQVFNLRGRYIDQWQGSLIGRPFGIAAGQRNQIMVIDGGDQPDQTRSRVLILNSRGRITTTFSAGIVSDSKNLGHDIAVGRGNAIYVADAWANCIRKFIPRAN
ncbi:MAG: hypothetical protein HOF15_08925 [Planctomycetaceae bacterium]|jgi:peptidylamidoglycolate lyase|nr:hypothetical protein [Planctomycetaceae bacterium]MBT4724205.1 hypothetical protein [Planctomycetaceae bacterium]MBT5124185.1 hypothetical protein [Planctomycetaceae bacterium]MBT5597690.1 hypothetical protein [Planctomycetaceae bacterium]MBT5885646.1 hypothetical protein [Planctomycetaceae bacterium]